MITDLLDHDPAAVLGATEALVRDRAELDVDEIRLAQHWADLHSTDPGGPRVPGGDYLATLGGEGTPRVQELCWAELAIARRAGVVATQHLGADALDLRHRLPLTWQAVQDLRLPAWVARKVAAMSRALGKDAVVVVDTAVAAAADQAPSRVIAIAEAKVIEADIEAHRARIAADAANVGVRVSRSRPGTAIDSLDGEPATRRVTLKLPTGSALAFDDTVREVAEALFDELPADERDTITRGALEAKAVELLLDPHAAAAFLDHVRDPGAETATTQDPKPTSRGRGVVYVHLSDLVLAGAVRGVARVEGLGPMLTEQLAELLDHRDITLQPVLDLRQVHAVNGYEHPTLVKERTLLRTLGDVFPHSTNLGYRRLDHDHAKPYLPPASGGPPGQTGDRNDAPLTRKHHRVKTHVAGYQVCQLALGAYRWTTPHGLGRVVTPRGTRAVEIIRDADGEPVGEIYPGPGIDLSDYGPSG